MPGYQTTGRHLLYWELLVDFFFYFNLRSLSIVSDHIKLNLETVSSVPGSMRESAWQKLPGQKGKMPFLKPAKIKAKPN